MPRALNTEDILADIEFELAQGAVGRGELGQAVQAVRQYGASLRGELLRPGRGQPDGRELASRQLQLNDMILALLGEIALAAEGVRTDWRKVHAWLTGRGAALAEDPPNAAESAAAPLASPRAVNVSEVADAMRAERLALPLDVRPAHPAPLIGPLLLRLRIALHSLTLFYTSRLAERQAAVNRAYGEALLRLADQCQAQQAEIAALRSQLAALQAALPERKNDL
jgi:hypothetical protein